VLQTKYKEIEINGVKLKLALMSTLDYLTLNKKYQGGINSEAEAIQSLVEGAYYSLQINLKELKWYQFIKRYKINKLISPLSLMKNLSAPQFIEIRAMLDELQGIEADKKKVAEAQSPMQPPTE
jgi:hypothetical protein